MRYKKIKEEDTPKEVVSHKWKRFAFLCILLVVLMAVYIIGIKFESKVMVYIYYASLLVLLVAFVILNRGFDRNSPEMDMLPDSWDDEKKKKYIADDIRRKGIARKLLYLIIPLLFIFAFDILYMALTTK